MRNVADVGTSTDRALRLRAAWAAVRRRAPALFFWLFAVFGFIEVPLGSPRPSGAAEFGHADRRHLGDGYLPQRLANLVDPDTGVADRLRAGVAAATADGDDHGKFALFERNAGTSVDLGSQAASTRPPLALAGRRDISFRPRGPPAA